jgi:CBS domain-containing protein
LSSRAACRLETLGFAEVYEYVAGKLDWLVNRRPVEGTRAGDPTVGNLARQDVVTSGLDDHAGDVRRRVADSAYPFALVLSRGGVVLGRVAASDLEGDPDQEVELLMDPGPKTYRPHKTAEGVAQELVERGLRWAVVTSPEGELIGVVSRDALDAAVRAQK